MLKKYLEDNCINKAKFARKIGIPPVALDNLVRDKSPNTRASTCQRIFEETGLSIKDYLEV